MYNLSVNQRQFNKNVVKAVLKKFFGMADYRNFFNDPHTAMETVTDVVALLKL